MAKYIATNEDEEATLTAQRIDFDEINAKLMGNIEAHCHQWLPRGKVMGGSYRIGGIDGSLGESMSINLRTGQWFDHATFDKGGDLISLYAAINDLSQGDAANELQGAVNIVRMTKPAKRKPLVSESDWEHALAIPSKIPDHPQHGQADIVYKYSDAEGRPIGVIMRWDLPDGSKTISQCSWMRHQTTKKCMWKWQAFNAPRPLYKGELLNKMPSADVVIVEGEKAADALASKLPDHVVLSWAGGCKAINQSDWAVLEGRNVSIWADNDKPGREAAKQLQEVTGGKIIETPQDKPEGWDAADAVEDGFDVMQLFEQAKPLTLFDKLQDRKFDPANLTPEKDPLLLLNGIPVLYAGNLLTLVGQDKSGKSHVEAAIAKAITEPNSRHLGFTCESFGRIAYIDCEQDRSDFESLLIRAGCDANKVAGYHLTGLTANNVKAALIAIMEGEPNLSAVLIDGFADLLLDVNDSEQANQLVAELMDAASSYNVAIIGVLHLNPGSDEKSRGHLGSQLGRKSQTVLQIKLQSDGSRCLFTQRARKQPIPEALGVRFAWDEEANGFLEIEGTPGEVSQAAKVEAWRRTLYDIQAETRMLAWKNKELIEAIIKAEVVKKRTAQNRIKEWLKANLLKHDAIRGVYTSTIGGAIDHESL
jgi:hypothetical protein